MPQAQQSPAKPIRVGIVLPLSGKQVFYPVHFLYQVCPAATSFGSDDLLLLIKKHPVRIG